MAGLNEIINQILEEAKSSADKVVEEANAQVDEIKKTSEAETTKMKQDIAKKSEIDQAAYRERIASNADLQKRTALLSAKQEVIEGIMRKSYDTFCNQDKEAYYETLKKMVHLYARPEKGNICFSEEDANSISNEFIEELNTIAKEQGGELTLSTETKKIDKGFILVYGGIEENCSFRAIFDTKKNDLQDLIYKELFSS